jgi:hypothetical protein
MYVAEHGNKAAARTFKSTEANAGYSKNDHASVFTRNAKTKHFMAGGDTLI